MKAAFSSSSTLSQGEGERDRTVVGVPGDLADGERSIEELRGEGQIEPGVAAGGGVGGGTGGSGASRISNPSLAT